MVWERDAYCHNNNNNNNNNNNDNNNDDDDNNNYRIHRKLFLSSKILLNNSRSFWIHLTSWKN